MSDSHRDLWLFKSYADEADVQAVTEILRRGTWWAKGDEIEDFESRIASRADCEYGVAFNSGTSAAYASLLAEDVAGGEVVVPSFTFAATANVVVAAGATPVFADIERDSLALDPVDVRAKVTDDTEAIMPIHFAGDVCAGIEELREIADAHGIPLIEDAAHSPCARKNDRPVGSFGDAAMFSFCFNKVLTTGEGGMIVTDDSDLQRTLRLIRSHGRDPARVYRRWGFNLRMPTMSAALGLSQEAKLDEMIQRRREMAAFLNEALGDIRGIEVPTPAPDREPVYQTYNIRLTSGDLQSPLQDNLAERGVPTRVTYDPVHLNNYYQSAHGCSPGQLPVTEEVSERILTLPFHLDLDNEDLSYIVETVRAFFADRGNP